MDISQCLQPEKNSVVFFIIFTFKSVLSNDMSPKFSPENSAENIKQVTMIIIDTQSGSKCS